jgi:hypothetical protein
VTRGDLLAIVLALALTGLLYARHWQAPAPATAVEIRSGDAPAQRHALAPDRVLRVQGVIGESIVELRDGGVRFRSGPCRNQVCVHNGWLRHGGDTAACLPNRVSVRLIGGRDTESVDGVSY